VNRGVEPSAAAAWAATDYTLAVLLARIRALLLVVVMVGTAGTLTELVLLSHYEDAYQMAPLALLAASLAAALLHAIHPSAGTVRVLQGAMTLCVAAAAAGMAFHFNGAAEFQLEIDPSLSWRQLFGKVVRAHAPPLLAPGSLLQLGLIGLIYTYRHPRLTGGDAHE
jgi:hypothetical protein